MVLLASVALVGCGEAGPGTPLTGASAPGRASAPEVLFGVEPGSASWSTLQPRLRLDSGPPPCERSSDWPAHGADPPAMIPAPVWIDNARSTTLRVRHPFDARSERPRAPERDA